MATFSQVAQSVLIMFTLVVAVTMSALLIQDRILRKRAAKRKLDEYQRKITERHDDYFRHRVVTDPYRQSARGDARDDEDGEDTDVIERPRQRMSQRSRKAADAWMRERYLESSDGLPPADVVGPPYTGAALVQQIERLNREITRLVAEGDIAGIKQRQRRRHELLCELDRQEGRVH